MPRRTNELVTLVFSHYNEKARWARPGATLPSIDEVGPDARALIAEARATRAGQFALEMFRRHRHPS